MKDEEVEFAHHYNYKWGTGDSAFLTGTLACLVTGVAGTIMAIPGWFGVGAAGLVGVCINRAYHKWYAAYRASRREKQAAKEEQLDAASFGDRVTFSYRGHDLECLLREDRLEGHDFEMRTNDVIHKPQFNFNPTKDCALTFIYGVERREFDNVSPVLMTHPETGELFVCVAKNSLEHLRAKIAQEVAGLCGGSDVHDHYNFGYAKKGSMEVFVLAYAGENYMRNLPIFAKMASWMMQTTHKFIEQYPQSISPS